MNTSKFLKVLAVGAALAVAVVTVVVVVKKLKSETDEAAVVAEESQVLNLHYVT